VKLLTDTQTYRHIDKRRVKYNQIYFGPSLSTNRFRFRLSFIELVARRLKIKKLTDKQTTQSNTEASRNFTKFNYLFIFRYK